MTAEELEVLHEQLDYLAVHASECGRPMCSECTRFRTTRGALLEAFQHPAGSRLAARIPPENEARYAAAQQRWYEAVARLGLQR